MSNVTGPWACVVALAAGVSGCRMFHLKYKAEK